MANNLYGYSLNSSNMQQNEDNTEVELASYLDDDCGVCARCGNREYLNGNKLCNNCNETWG